MRLALRPASESRRPDMLRLDKSTETLKPGNSARVRHLRLRLVEPYLVRSSETPLSGAIWRDQGTL
jgi:hypothetical protein